MSTRRITVASLTLAGLCAGVCSPAWAQQQQPYPDPSQPYQAQPYQAQPYQPQPYQAQPYQPQPYQAQPYQAQPYQPQPYQPQPYQPQPYYPPVQTPYVQGPRGVVRYVYRPRVGLVVAGAVVLGTTWLLSAAGAYANSGSSTAYDCGFDSCTVSSGGGGLGYASAVWPLYIPVLGPWIEMGFLSGSGAPAGNALLAFDGLVQAGGLAMLIAGAASRIRVAVYANNGPVIKDLKLSPMLGASGVLASGRF